MDSIYGEENSDKTEESIKPNCSVDFGWFAPTSGAFNHVVKDWNPKYEGIACIALATTLKTGKSKYYTMDDDGNIIEVSGLGTSRIGMNSDNRGDKLLSTIQEYNNWAFVTQYPYSADMTIIGAPCETVMTGRIRVIARMGSQKHHSSGVYMILGKTDKISSSGFFSEFKLFKFVAGYDPAYTMDIGTTNDETNDNPTVSTEQTQAEKDARDSSAEMEEWKANKYKLHPNYAKDAEAIDVRNDDSLLNRLNYDALFVGKDGDLYFKAYPDKQANLPSSPFSSVINTDNVLINKRM